MSLNPKAHDVGLALSYWSPTERLVRPSCPTARGSETASEAEFSTSFNHINEASICIAIPNTLLHGAHTFSIYSPARPVTSLPPQRLCNATNRNAAAFLCKSLMTFPTWQSQISPFSTAIYVQNTKYCMCNDAISSSLLASGHARGNELFSHFFSCALELPVTFSISYNWHLSWSGYVKKRWALCTDVKGQQQGCSV